MPALVVSRSQAHVVEDFVQAVGAAVAVCPQSMDCRLLFQVEVSSVRPSNRHKQLSSPRKLARDRCPDAVGILWY